MFSFRILQGERLNRIASFFALGILNAVIRVTVFGLYFSRRPKLQLLLVREIAKWDSSRHCRPTVQ